MISTELMRSLLKEAWEKGLFSTAALLAEKICCQDNSVLADRILLAKCHLSSGQPRRCLAVLEQFGFLSTATIESLRQVILPLVEENEREEPQILPQQDTACIMEAILLAARCLYSTEQYESCISLLQPIISLDQDEDNDRLISHSQRVSFSTTKGNSDLSEKEINPVSCIYCLIGECYEKLDNRTRAIRSFRLALQIDKICIEAILFLSERGLLSPSEKRELCEELEKTCEHRHWINSFLRVSLLQEEPARYDRTNCDVSAADHFNDMRSSSGLIRQATYCFNQQNFHDAYRLARHAYTLDPHGENGLAVYVASMTELSLKTELFYLGHELVNSIPKSKLSWYCVGCYYWCCKKYELAQKYLLKATKLDKRYYEAWLLLGHVLSCQEEIEQSIAAYRTAARLMPGDHRPLICMAKELVRTNVLPLAQQLLLSAAKINPQDAGLLNELGVIAVKMGQMEMALDYFEKAVQLLGSNRPGSAEGSVHSAVSNYTFRKSCGPELFSNYATALRKCEHYEDALYWYDKCLAVDPNDANTHASMAFTFHLMQRFDRAIVSYHRALAIRPKFTFCSDMLSRAMDDMSYFPTVQGDTLGSGDPTGSPSRDNRHVPLRSAASRDDTDGGGKLLRGSLITSTPDLSVVNSFSNIAWRLSIGSDLVNAPVFPESPF